MASAFAAISLLPGCLAAGHEGTEASTAAPGMTCPAVLDLADGFGIEVISVRFTDEIQGQYGKMTMHATHEQAQEELKFCVATLRITKPAGRRITLAAADLAVHFWRGDEPRVIGCTGLSSFDTEKEAPRPLQIAPTEGFLFVRSSTGARTTQAAEVFIDAVFVFVPADARQLWVCLAQPIDKRPYLCAAPKRGGGP